MKTSGVIYKKESCPEILFIAAIIIQAINDFILGKTVNRLIRKRSLREIIPASRSAKLFLFSRNPPHLEWMLKKLGFDKVVKIDSLRKLATDSVKPIYKLAHEDEI